MFFSFAGKPNFRSKMTEKTAQGKIWTYNFLETGRRPMPHNQRDITKVRT